jgi:hypothetical protein
MAAMEGCDCKNVSGQNSRNKKQPLDVALDIAKYEIEDQAALTDLLLRSMSLLSKI